MNCECHKSELNEAVSPESLSSTFPLCTLPTLPTLPSYVLSLGWYELTTAFYILSGLRHPHFHSALWITAFPHSATLPLYSLFLLFTFFRELVMCLAPGWWYRLLGLAH